MMFQMECKGLVESIKSNVVDKRQDGTGNAISTFNHARVRKEFSSPQNLDPTRTCNPTHAILDIRIGIDENRKLLIPKGIQELMNKKVRSRSVTQKTIEFGWLNNSKYWNYNDGVLSFFWKKVADSNVSFVYFFLIR